MALVSGSLKNLLGGVSQAPPEQRHSSQFTELLNMLPRRDGRLSRRPPLVPLEKIATSDLSDSFAFEFGEYTVVISAGTIRAFETNSGTPVTVTDSTGWGYHNTTADALRVAVSGDTAYILNTGITPSKGGVTAGLPSNRAHVTVRAGDYETRYVVVLDGVVFTYTTPAEATAGSKADIATDAIAAELTTLIDAHATFVAVNFGSTIYVARADVAAFSSVVTYDGLSDEGLSVALNSVKQFSDLPPRAEDATVLKVMGDPGTAVDDYYVLFDADTSSWVECTEPGSLYTLDEETMPVRLVNTGSGLTLESCPWSPREAGDDTTVPFPSFFATTTTDIFVYDGRLGVVCEDRIILSEAGNHFNFFRTTATQILASDPIDVSGAISGVVKFDWAVNWNQALYLFANGRAQYRLDSADGPLSSSTVRLLHKSGFAYEPLVKPIAVGARLFFVKNDSGFWHVVDYYTRGYDGIHTANDTGAQLPRYFDGLPQALTADETRGILFYRTSTGLYVYNYGYDGDDRVQGAWHRWTFGAGTLVSMLLKEGVLYTVMAYADGTWAGGIALEQVQVTFTTDGTGAAVPAGTMGENPYLDRLVDSDGLLTLSYDGTTYTTLTLPYAVAVDGSEGNVGVVLYDGRALSAIDRPTATTARFTGDLTAIPTQAGVRYFSDVQLSTLYVRDRDGVPDVRGRLQLHTLRVQYFGASRIEVLVASTGRSTRSEIFTALYPTDGEMVTAVALRNVDADITVRMDSAASDSLTGISWEGTYHTRAARL